jgi:putative sigma-54 modulation protein
MISKLEISATSGEVDKDIKKYVEKKIGKLDGYMPRHARKSAHAEVKLKESKVKNLKQSTAEVILFVPGEQLQAKETTLNMYAAIDIVEEKMKSQLKKYKDLHKKAARENGGRIRRALGKIVPSR